MGQIEQNTANIAETRQLLNGLISNAKQTGDLTAQATVNPTSKIRVEGEYVTIQQLINITQGLWKNIEGSWVEKDIANVSETVLEVGDLVYFKKISNGTDPLTLVGQTYDGGDKQLRASYTQTQAID